jgi:hypothetical protein
LYRCFIAALVMALLTYQVDADVTAVTWRRLAVALLSAAGVATLAWVGAFWPKYTRLGAARFLGLASEKDLPRTREKIRGLVRQESGARYGQAVVPHLRRRGKLARAGITTISGFLVAYFVYANFSQDSWPPLIAGIVGQRVRDDRQALPPGD